jgi:hypothetical protein
MKAFDKLLAAAAVLPFVAPVSAKAAFQYNPPSVEYVLGTDHNLWRERSDKSIDYNLKNRQLIDGNVAKFQAAPVCCNVVYVLGTDGKLWREPGDMTHRGHKPVDENVLQFQVWDDNTVYVLGTDGNLWREQGNQSVDYNLKHRQGVDQSVAQFQALDGYYVYVLRTDGNLWIEPSAMIYPIGKQVSHFQADTHGNVYLLHTDRSLQRVYPNGKPPASVDANVLAFQALDETYVYVLGTDGKLWRERGNMNNRDLVAQGVRGFQALDRVSVDILWADRELRNNLASADIDADVLGFQNLQAPVQATGLLIRKCPAPKTLAPQIGPVPNVSPPCISSLTKGIVDGTSEGVHWATVPYTVVCNPGDPCKWEYFTNDYDQYNVRYGYAEDDTGKWEQHNYGGDVHDLSINNREPGRSYGVIIEGHVDGVGWTSWSDPTFFICCDLTP